MKSIILCSSILLTMLVSPSSHAQSSVDAAIAQCRTEQNALKRLVCYDDIKTVSNTAVIETKMPAATENNIKRPNNSEFGREHKQAKNDSADQIYVIVKSIRYNARKEMTVEFDNGQVWRQVGSGTYQINEGEQHFIKRGMLGAFYLGSDRNNRTVKISRED